MRERAHARQQDVVLNPVISTLYNLFQVSFDLKRGILELYHEEEGQR